MQQQQESFYESKLRFEMDSWDLHAAQKKGEDIVVLDVRSLDAYNAEHIDGAISFPHGQMLEETTQGLPKDKSYVVYCDGIGCNASTSGALKMTRLGFQVKELIGGLKWWREHGYPTVQKANSSLHAEQAQEATAINCACD